MKKIINKRNVILIVFCLFIHANFMDAKEYRILRLWNCKSIKIGNNVMTVGNTFHDEMTIHWTNARQLMEVEETVTGETMKIGQKGFERKKVKTLLDLLTKEESMGHRTYTSGEQYYTEKDYYLTDSLHFPVLDIPNSNATIEALWEYKGKEIITPIKLTDDGKFYIITPDVFGNKKPRDIKLSIRERVNGRDWTNNVYHDIPILYIPTKN